MRQLAWKRINAGVCAVEVGEGKRGRERVCEREGERERDRERVCERERARERARETERE